MDKFKGFKEACECEADFIIVTELGILGDTIKEINDNITYAISKGKEIKVINGSSDYTIRK